VRRAHGDHRTHQRERRQRRNEFQPPPHGRDMGARGGDFQLSFGQMSAYFTGTWSTCGQTAAASATFSAPTTFFGAPPRQLSLMSSGLDGV
jgi:hypothetical protein